MSLRVGFGFDVHRLDEGQPFFLGGIKIPHSKGAVGHSDADVLIHTMLFLVLRTYEILVFIFQIRMKSTKVLIVKFY